MKFIGRKINTVNETIGERLRASREKEGLSLENISASINVRKDYLKALEENNYQALPEGLYKENFLKKYSEFLGMDWKKIKKEFRQTTREKGVKLDFSPKKIKKTELLIFPKIFRNILAGLIITAFFIYIGFYIKTNISPPNIQIIEPVDDLITDNNSLTVIGRADTKAQITINGISVLSNESGIFEQEISLKEGVNTITITARKKYGPKKTIQKQVLVE